MIEAERLLAPSVQHIEEPIERAMRPKTLEAYLGQAPVRQQMRLFIDAAKQRQDALDHVLIFGPPGLGKTTLAHIIAHEMGANIRTTSDLSSKKLAILPRFSPTLKKAMFYLLMKFIVCIRPLKKFCILRWKTFS